MAEFDPYRKWLGIPPAEQPPNLYRLLGIGLFESDAEVIAGAADRQLFHVRNFQSGAYADIAQFILNELSTARACLLDPQGKAQYDQWLRQTLPPAPAMPPGVAPQTAAATAYGGYPQPGPAPGAPAAPAPWANPAAATARPPAISGGRRPVVVRRTGDMDDFLATVSAPITHHGHAAGHHKKKKSLETMGAAIALVVLSVAIVLGFLAFYLGQNNSSGPGSPDAPLIGPGQQVIHIKKVVPAPSTDVKKDHAAERPRPVGRVAQPIPPAPVPAQQDFGNDSFPDISAAPNVDRTAPVIPQPNRGAAPNPAPPDAGQAKTEEPAAGDDKEEPAQKKDTLDKAVK